MLKTVRNVSLSIVIGLSSLMPAHAAHAARHALLIGNDSYQDVPTLRNARADADAMAAALEKAGYAVTVMKDRDLKQMKDDVRIFKSQIKGGDEVVFFYSGHGVQIEAMNYLLPVDVRADSEDQVRDDALALSRVLEDFRTQKPALTVAVIDACRDNPFKGTGRAIGGRGLTGVGGANGQMVIYSAGEGQQALDRLSDGDPVKNGLFTRVFIQEMTQPGVPIDQVARKVRAEVNRMAKTVNHEQVPAIYDQVIGQFYFYAQNDTGVDEVEILFWQSVEDSTDPAELQAYLEKYPKGQFSGLAQARLKRIEQSKPVPGALSAPGSVTPAVDVPATKNEPAVAQTIADQPKVESRETKTVTADMASAPVPTAAEEPKTSAADTAAKPPVETQQTPSAAAVEHAASVTSEVAPAAMPAASAPVVEATVPPAENAVPLTPPATGGKTELADIAPAADANAGSNHEANIPETASAPASAEQPVAPSVATD